MVQIAVALAAGNNDAEAVVLLLRCGDLYSFAMPVSLALQRPTTRAAAAAGAGERALDLPRGVSGSGVATVVDYWAGRAAAAAHGVDLGEFDSEFARGLTHDAAVDAIHAAHHLGDDALIDLVSSSMFKSLDLDVSAAAAPTF